ERLDPVVDGEVGYHRRVPGRNRRDLGRGSATGSLGSLRGCHDRSRPSMPDLLHNARPDGNGGPRRTPWEGAPLPLQSYPVRLAGPPLGAEAHPTGEATVLGGADPLDLEIVDQLGIGHSDAFPFLDGERVGFDLGGRIDVAELRVEQ